jgi:hypothetical protein
LMVILSGTSGSNIGCKISMRRRPATMRSAIASDAGQMLQRSNCSD